MPVLVISCVPARSRIVTARSILMAMSAFWYSTSRNCSCPSTRQRIAVAATTVAVRGPLSRSAISPKKSPGPSVRRPSGASTLAEPSRITKKSPPVSPFLQSVRPEAKSTSSAWDEMNWSSLSVQPPKSGTERSRSIRGSATAGSLGPHQLGSAHPDQHAQEVGIRAGDPRDDRGVRYVHIRQAPNLGPRVDDALRARADAARPGGMGVPGHVLANPAADRGRADGTRRIHNARERKPARDLARDAYARFERVEGDGTLAREAAEAEPRPAVV